MGRWVGEVEGGGVEVGLQARGKLGSPISSSEMQGLLFSETMPGVHTFQQQHREFKISSIRKSVYVFQPENPELALSSEKIMN